MSNQCCWELSSAPVTRKIVHWCSEECDNHDSSWHVTMVRSHITHHLLVDRQFRVGHQIWHRGWHGFLCVAAVCCSQLPFHSVRTLWTMVIWLNVTQGSISPLSYSLSVTHVAQILTVFVQAHKNVAGLMWTKDKVAGYTYILVLAALQSQR
mgnify:CR=1 FL=1